jgi:hypothetical protein
VKPRKTWLATAAALTLAATAANAQPSGGVEIGVLTCSTSGGSGFILGSTKTLYCIFSRQGRPERYVGTISRFGIDVGMTTQSLIAWAVLAPTADVPRGALHGDYGGVSGEATIGVGLGANALVGGSGRAIVLQPISVQAQQGLNLAAGVAALQLRLTR